MRYPRLNIRSTCRSWWCNKRVQIDGKMLNDAVFKVNVDAAIQIMKYFNVTAQEALKVLQVPETEYPRYLAAI